jgi:hypothetical protein
LNFFTPPNFLDNHDHFMEATEAADGLDHLGNHPDLLQGDGIGGLGWGLRDSDRGGFNSDGSGSNRLCCRFTFMLALMVAT